MSVWAGMIDNILLSPFVVPNRLNVALLVRRNMWMQQDMADLEPYYTTAVRQCFNENYPKKNG